MLTPNIIVITGQTCAGKSTLEQALVDAGATRLVSTTTRAPRDGETAGVDYHFVSETDFVAMAQRGEFIETNKHHGALYGIASSEVARAMANSSDAPIVAVVEPNGRRAFERAATQNGWMLTRVWINVSPSVQAERFLSRVTSGALSPKAAATRLASMMVTERAWLEEVAFTGVGERPCYDLLIRQLDDDTVEQAVQKVLGVMHARRQIFDEMKREAAAN